MSEFLVEMEEMEEALERAKKNAIKKIDMEKLELARHRADYKLEQELEPYEYRGECMRKLVYLASQRRITYNSSPSFSSDKQRSMIIAALKRADEQFERDNTYPGCSLLFFMVVIISLSLIWHLSS